MPLPRQGISSKGTSEESPPGHGTSRRAISRQGTSDRAVSGKAPSQPWPLLAARASFFAGGALPWLLPFARAALPLGPVGALLDGAFFFVCHRLPERTLVLASTPMPLCSRCAGVALGLALGGLVAWPSPSVRATRTAVLAAALLMIADVVTQDLGVHPVWHSTRLLTGALLGYSLATGLFAAIRREASLLAEPPPA